MKQPAQLSAKLQKGIAQIVLIGAAAIVGLVIIGIATGGIKGSFKFTKTDQTQESKSSVSQNQEESPTPSPTPKAQLEETQYVNTAKGYSIKYPKGWKYQDDQTNTAFWSNDAGGSMEGASSAIVINVSPLGTLKGAQFSTIVDSIRISLKNQYSIQEMETDKSVKVGTYDGHVLGITIEKDGVSFAVDTYIVVQNDNMYSIIALTKKDALSKYSDAIQDSIATFKIL